MTKKFTRTIEDFKCDKCDHLVKGSGYTNHCPNCLYSKHVDINPGDRESDCKGLMEPVDVIREKGQIYINYKCEKCGFERRNKIANNDNFEAIQKIINKKIYGQN